MKLNTALVNKRLKKCLIVFVFLRFYIEEKIDKKKDKCNI